MHYKVILPALLPVFISVSIISFGLFFSQNASAEPRSKVIINGIAAPVFFNDGDSFRVLDGRLEGTKCRLGGYNTLESHGAVHRWGTWTVKEMYNNAKMATTFARKRSWQCTTDMQRDIYLRVLMHCPELATEQIRLGYAHALSITAGPARAEYLEAQAEAIAARRGMWAHGVPDFIVTSLHSIEEDPTKEWTYNRVVSTKDGHSEKWRHQRKYEECEDVCTKKVTIEPAVMMASLTEVRKNPRAMELLANYSPKDLKYILRIWLKLDTVAAMIPKENKEELALIFKDLSDRKILVAASEEEESCMIYTDFLRRFGGDKAKCLR